MDAGRMANAPNRLTARVEIPAACGGRKPNKVNPAFTSLMCSGCGVLVQKGLSVRWHSCPECGVNLHRDHNAAKNILVLGKNQQSGAGQALQV